MYLIVVIAAYGDSRSVYIGEPTGASTQSVYVNPMPSSGGSGATVQGETAIGGPNAAAAKSVYLQPGSGGAPGTTSVYFIG